MPDESTSREWSSPTHEDQPRTVDAVRPQYERLYLLRGTTIDGPAHAPGTEVEVTLRATVIDDYVVDDYGVQSPRLALLVKDWTGPVAA